MPSARLPEKGKSPKSTAAMGCSGGVRSLHPMQARNSWMAKNGAVSNMDDARERIGTALKEIKPISISINCNLPSTCILVLSFFSPRGKLASSLFMHKADEMDMCLVLLMLMNCSFVNLSNKMSLKGTKRNDYSFTSLCIVNLSFDWCLNVLVDKMTCLLISCDMCFHWLLAAF